MVTELLFQQLHLLEGVRLWSRAPLAPFTTIGTGGKADLLVTVDSSPALSAVLAVLEQAGVIWTCLGAGSNLLVADRGYSGVVVKLGQTFQYVEGLPSPGEILKQEQVIRLTAGAGTHLSRLSAVAAEAGLAGLEFACGIPGSVGGAVAMNAGAHGACLAGIVEAVEVVSAREVTWLTAEELVWGYRCCTLPADAVVTNVRLRLTAGDRQEVMERQRALLRARRQSQPRGARTFGSVFKNPPESSAGRLLEAAGLKGVRRGGAEVSTVHANFIVNTGEANTTDVLALMSLMRQGVHHMSGLLLEPEVRLLGEAFPWAGEQGKGDPPGVAEGGFTDESGVNTSSPFGDVKLL